VTDLLLGDSAKGKKQSDAEDFALPERKTIEKLNQSATDKLAEIVRRYSANERLWQGYNANEVAAARELLSKSSSELVR
jgi:ER membrane protein complex subunit 2